MSKINTDFECQYEYDCGATCLEMLGYEVSQEEELRNWQISNTSLPDDFVEVYERVEPAKHLLYRTLKVLLIPIWIPLFIVGFIAYKCERAYNWFFFKYLHVKVPNFESLSDKPLMFNGLMQTSNRLTSHWCIYYKGVVYDPLGEELTVEELTERGVNAVYYCYELTTWPNIDKEFKLQPYWLEEE
jgi:hypothetical protein